MKIFPVILFAIITAAVFGENAPTAASPADTDWASIQPLLEQMPDPPPARLTKAFYTKWNETRLRRLQVALLAFYEKYPDDPRRWEAVSLALLHQPAFHASYKPEFDAHPDDDNLVIDEQALAQWKEHRTALIAEVLASPAATVEAREVAEVAALRVEWKSWSVPDKARIEAEATRLARAYPEGEQVYFMANALLRDLEETDAAAAAKLWTGLLTSPHRHLRETAEGVARVEQGKAAPLELKFTALDGREVDLVRLRGKVVLVDFWAMWCGPCLAELPNLKRVYDAYHAKGFEVIGISLDAPNERAGLEAFLKKKDMTWPQHYDGLNWHTPLALKFGVRGIPSMLLLGRDGRIVSTDARGEELEPAVRKQLGLPPL